MLLLSSAYFFQKFSFFKKFFLEHNQSDKWFGSRSGPTFVEISVLICVQTVCKGYRQTTNVAASKERVKHANYLGNVMQWCP